MTPRRVARVSEWTMWDGSQAPAVPESFLLFYRLACASLVFWTVIICVTDPGGLTVRVAVDKVGRLVGGASIAGVPVHG